MSAIDQALKNNIKIAFGNECFELWILFHFQKATSPINRGTDIEKKINSEFKKHGLGNFIKNQKVFNILLPFQQDAIKNGKDIVPSYDKIDWENVLGPNGNPSTSIHFLVDEINKVIDEK